VDLTLSSEQERVRAALREWVDAEVAPRAIEADRDEKLPPEALAGLRSGGWLGLTIPEQYGGGVADPLTYVLMIEELGRGDANVRSIVSVHLGLVAGPILRWGTDAQKDRWLPAMATGETLGCFCLTEPDHGSDPAHLTTAATREEGGWRIDGRKMFITNGDIAGLALVMARTGGEGAKGISAFLVPTDTEGFAPRPLHGKLGLRSCDTAEIALDGVRVGDEALLGAEGGGLRVALGGLDDGRVSLGASCVGLGQAALEAMSSYAGQREQFGRSIAGFQLIQELIADAAVEVEAARMLVWRAADLQRRGEPYTVAASMAKYYASECSVRAANAAVQVHGGYGYVDEFVAGKLLRDARVTTLYEGTSQVQKLLIGRAMTGVSAFT
jgi:alkylation response protein AidB-like acyl-CoA dehydrogenase